MEANAFIELCHFFFFLSEHSSVWSKCFCTVFDGIFEDVSLLGFQLLENIPQLYKNSSQPSWLSVQQSWSLKVAALDFIECINKKKTKKQPFISTIRLPVIHSPSG